MEDSRPDRVNVRSSAELLNKGLIINAYSNAAVAVALIAQTLVVIYLWS